MYTSLSKLSCSLLGDTTHWQLLVEIRIAFIDGENAQLPMNVDYLGSYHTLFPFPLEVLGGMCAYLSAMDSHSRHWAKLQLVQLLVEP